MVKGGGRNGEQKCEGGRGHLKTPLRGQGNASTQATLPLPPPPLTTAPTAPARVPRVEHAGTEPEPKPSPQERSAQGAGPHPGTHPRLEPLRGGKAQPRTAFLSRSRATRLRSRSGCSRCRRCPLVGFTRGGEGREVNAATARAAGRSHRLVLTSEGPARTARFLIPRLLRSSEKPGLPA